MFSAFGDPLLGDLLLHVILEFHFKRTITSKQRIISLKQSIIIIRRPSSKNRCFDRSTTTHYTTSFELSPLFLQACSGEHYW